MGNVELKYYAYYLPQYHPIPENDNWWGEGFTEWRNVVTAKPRYRGHYQPHIPADLGFYDLRLDETKNRQVEIAKKYGIDGFIYYHYWFLGKRLLDTPIMQVLANRNISFPFALCWANETWSRAWDGEDHQILIEQKYSQKDHNIHANYLADIFKDERYIKIENHPLLLIYRPMNLKYGEVFYKELADACVIRNLEKPIILGTRTGFSSNGMSGQYIDFQPNRDDFTSSQQIVGILSDYLRKYLPRKIYNTMKTNVNTFKRINYKQLVDYKISQYRSSEYKAIPCVFPSWDNTPRRKAPVIIENNDPKSFKKWLLAATDYVLTSKEVPKIVFINAWNEWAEGCHLEPDIRNGNGFLKVISEIKGGVNQS